MSFDPWWGQSPGKGPANVSFGAPQGKGLQKPIMEYKVITDYPVIGDDRKGFREWWYKLRKNLKSITNPEVDAIPGLIEKVYLEVSKNPSAIRMRIDEDNCLYGRDLTVSMESLDTVFTNKFESGSTPYLMFKRVNPSDYHDVILRLSKIYGWYLDLTG